MSIKETAAVLFMAQTNSPGMNMFHSFLNVFLCFCSKKVIVKKQEFMIAQYGSFLNFKFSIKHINFRSRCISRLIQWHLSCLVRVGNLENSF